MKPENPELRALLDRFALGPTALARVVASVPADLLRRRPAPGKWSVHHVVCHLADSEVFTGERIRRTLAEKAPRLMAWDQDAYADALAYEARDLDVELESFAALRRANHALLARVPRDAFARTATHSVTGPMTLRDLLAKDADHPFEHIAQIRRALAALQGR